jgi:hypothetical protein
MDLLLESLFLNVKLIVFLLKLLSELSEDFLILIQLLS